MPILAKFDARYLANLAYAYALIEQAPKLEDGSALFDHVGSIPLLGKFKPQELANTVWAFEKVQVSSPPLFEAVANHIVGLKQLDNFAPQAGTGTRRYFFRVGGYGCYPYPVFFRVGYWVFTRYPKRISLGFGYRVLGTSTSVGISIKRNFPPNFLPPAKI